MTDVIHSVYLNKTKHFPPIDNQGMVNSCLSQSFVYIQMTNAVSRKTDSAKWEPSIFPEARFSPRFTYLLARSNPVGIYRFLKDHGCLTMDVCAFRKDAGGGSVEFEDGIPIKESVSWNVARGEMKRSLRYRISRFSKTSVNDLERNDLINKIKKSLQDGNIVISTTKMENWIQSELAYDCGEYGRKGDTIIVASRRYIPVGHSFAIVGYDDNIEIKFSGVTFKGAFLITCGYGTVWMNQGYCWVLYDAIFSTSQHDIMNGKEIYIDDMFLTSYYGNPRIFSPMHISNKIKEVQDFVFTPVGRIEIEGCVFSTYRIINPLDQTCLGITRSEDSLNEKVEFSIEGKNDDEWCIVSYQDISKWGSFIEGFDSHYKNCYWIFSVEHYKKNSALRCFLDSGLDHYNIGRRVGHSRLNDGRYPEAKSWKIENFSTNDSFRSTLGISYKDENLPKRRTCALREFWFVDWKEDVEIGLPQLMVDLELETVDREAFEVMLIRFDPIKKEYESNVPAMFCINHTQYVDNGDTMTFRGEINSPLPETGFFTFQYSDLLNIPADKKMTDYQWGVQIRSKNNHPVIIKKVAIVNSRDEELDSMSFYEDPIILCNDSVAFITSLNSIIE